MAVSFLLLEVLRPLRLIHVTFSTKNRGLRAPPPTPMALLPKAVFTLGARAQYPGMILSCAPM